MLWIYRNCSDCSTTSLRRSCHPQPGGPAEAGLPPGLTGVPAQIHNENMAAAWATLWNEQENTRWIRRIYSRFPALHSALRDRPTISPIRHFIKRVATDIQQREQHFHRRAAASHHRLTPFNAPDYWIVGTVAHAVIKDRPTWPRPSFQAIQLAPGTAPRLHTDRPVGDGLAPNLSHAGCNAAPYVSSSAGERKDEIMRGLILALSCPQLPRRRFHHSKLRACQTPVIIRLWATNTELVI